jgi:hypothetical protein
MTIRYDALDASSIVDQLSVQVNSIEAAVMSMPLAVLIGCMYLHPSFFPIYAPSMCVAPLNVSHIICACVL